jgi:hypothetical protein
MRSTEPILVKRYAGSRLYDTEGPRYVTLDDLVQWQARGFRFEVREGKPMRYLPRFTRVAGKRLFRSVRCSSRGRPCGFESVSRPG